VDFGYNQTLAAVSASEPRTVNVTAENWEQIKRIVDHCLRLEPGERDAYIAQASAGNEEIADEVASLVASSSEAGDFLETPVFETTLIDRVASEDLPGGQDIGPYRILDLIGHGGMGSVYRAVRSSDFQQMVAIKVVKRGMDTQFILERFRQERQILATLDHPNIARLLDGGATVDGRPYIVMELVEGQPITDYANSGQLTGEEKLRLFQTVCSAVQHAHQNLVIHRDLKASNILVTAHGVPKLLDFGIAKLLEPDTSQTATAIRMMTPECASPEQVRGEPLNTLTDVYSLGVLLYELLTGTSPHLFSSRDHAEIQRVICNEDPPRPSTVRPLSGDLDNIILKAMDKDPLRRYVSAAQLLEDIDRFLSGLPVIARSSTLGYRVSKFVKRHLAATLTAALVVASLAAGFGTALWQAKVARLERGRAERRFADTHGLARSLLFDIHDAIKDLPGSTPARKLIVDRSLTYLDLLSREETGDKSLDEDLAAAYVRVGDVQGGPNYANLGDSVGAMASYRKALQIRQSLAAAHPADLSVRRHLSDVYRRIANQNIWFGNIVEASPTVEKLLAIDQTIAVDSLHSSEDQFRLAADYELAGDLLSGNGTTGSLDDDRGALENHRKALEITSTKPEDNSTRARDVRAVQEEKIASDLSRLGEWEDALQRFDKALQVFETLASGNPMRRVQVAIMQGRIGDTLVMAGDPVAALAHYRTGLELWRRLLDQDPQNASLRMGMAGAYGSCGFALIRSGRLVEGMGNLQACERIVRRELATDKESVFNRAMLAMLEAWFAEAYRLSGDNGHALARGLEAVDTYQSLFKAEPRDAASRLNLAASHNLLGIIRLEQGTLDQARKAFQEALKLAEPSGGPNGKSEAAKYVLADACAGLGGVEARSDSLTEAQSWYRRSASVWSTVTHPGLLSPNSFPTLGPAHVRTELDRIDSALARRRRNP
jgi:tetratricopeptide (TPR) repeat protein/tRNA A-37 threonylcarbamoyl transferase component Bud32